MDLLVLPKDVLKLIMFKYLKGQDAISLSLTCKYLYNLTNKEQKLRMKYLNVRSWCVMFSNDEFKNILCLLFQCPNCFSNIGTYKSTYHNGYGWFCLNCKQMFVFELISKVSYSEIKKHTQFHTSSLSHNCKTDKCKKYRKLAILDVGKNYCLLKSKTSKYVFYECQVCRIESIIPGYFSSFYASENTANAVNALNKLTKDDKKYFLDLLVNKSSSKDFDKIITFMKEKQIKTGICMCGMLHDEYKRTKEMFFNSCNTNEIDGNLFRLPVNDINVFAFDNTLSLGCAQLHFNNWSYFVIHYYNPLAKEDERYKTSCCYFSDNKTRYFEEFLTYICDMYHIN